MCLENGGGSSESCYLVGVYRCAEVCLSAAFGRAGLWEETSVSQPDAQITHSDTFTHSFTHLDIDTFIHTLIRTLRHRFTHSFTHLDT